MVRRPFHRFVEWFLPWFDVECERSRDARTARILGDAERVRRAYIAAARTPFIERRQRPR